TMTEIPYAIPSDGTVNVKIMSVSGQVLYQKEIQATAGNHSLVVDIDFLSNGIYYYSMGYAGRTIVKKMTVNK
ncbi:MAG: T9SS type A sorting domain-containing protein, partial [Bacteroidales bacterium]|nr:T9SS type A sorting domain-containing protein [Bacteroidales bacterium]